jgi:hypothetical protein
MANALTLTELAPVIYRANDLVAREATGFINSVTVNRAGSIDAAFGDKVQSFITSQPTVGSTITPAMAVPDADDYTVGKDDFALSQTASVKIPMPAEKLRQLDNSFGAESVMGDIFQQAIRTLVNRIESYLAGVMSLGASRAVGVATATPFASDFNEIALLRKILMDNGCPVDDGGLSLVVDSAAGANLRNLAQLQKVNESGGDNLLRRGELLNLQGFSLKESAGVARQTAGTGTGDTLSGTPAIGTRLLTFSAFSDGEYVAGDAFVIQDDPNIYVIESAAHASNQVTIAAPGLRVTGVNGKTITRVASHTANLGFHRLSTELAMRAPATVPGGDKASDVITVSDAKTGLSFSVSEYKGYKMTSFHFDIYYGAKVWKPEFVARLIGQ